MTQPLLLDLLEPGCSCSEHAVRFGPSEVLDLLLFTESPLDDDPCFLGKRVCEQENQLYEENAAVACFPRARGLLTVSRGPEGGGCRKRVFGPCIASPIGRARHGQ